MIKVSFRKSPDWQFLGASHVRKLKERILSDLRAGLDGMQESILLTPVYTGKTLVNYRWSVGGSVKDLRSPVKTPALPGTTSTMELGAEPRRAANSALVRREYLALRSSLSKNLFQKIYLTNNTPYFDLVEYGNYATKEGTHSRTPPGGMVRRGETLLEAAMPGLRKVSGDV